MALCQRGRDVMGFTPKQKIYRLRFEDPDFAGLIVMIKPAPVGAIMSATRIAGLKDFDFAGVSSLDNETLGILGEINEMFQTFAEALIEWNLEEDGKAIPPTIEGIKGEDAQFIMQIIQVWTDTSGSVSTPLDKPSNDGELSAVAYLPMEALSVNQ